MPALERIEVYTGSDSFDLAPAVLTVLEEAGKIGLESPHAISSAVRVKFNIEQGRVVDRFDRREPDYNIDWAVSYLIKGKCIRADYHSHIRFITSIGQEVLNKMPLADIQNLVKVFKAASREDLEESFKDLEESIDLGDQDDRVRGLREIDIRIDQVKFRRKVMKAFDGKCAITQSRVRQLLEAAHISPYRGPHTNVVTNGLLLRVDFHQLFDKDLIGIDPETRRIRISEDLIGTEYERFSDCELAKPASHILNRRSLEARWKKFLGEG